jgi:Flp pilus assembly protein TadD
MLFRTFAAVLAGTLLLSGCTLTRPAPFASPATPTPAPGAAQPPGVIASPGSAETAAAAPERPSAPPPKQFHLSAASASLVTQAHTQALSGDYGPAATTLERALRIEPENPLLWIELGRVRLGESNPTQADALGRKALSLATGDPSAQSSAWRLIADSLRARGRNVDAAEADQHAQGVASR